MVSTSAEAPTEPRGLAPRGRTRRASKAPPDTSIRLAVLVFVGLLLVAAALRLIWARGAWFTVDDWELLSNRTVGDMGDLFRPHFGHWITLIVIAYRFLWQIAGLHYLPYQLFEIALYLGSAAMTRVVMRRVGVSPWVATGVASVVLFTGGGANLFFTSALILGMAQLLCADHDGPVDRRDYLGLLAGFGALLCSGVAVTMIAAVGLAVFLRRGWRVAVFHTVPLAGVYLCWSRFSPSSSDAGADAGGVGEVVRFVVIGVQTALDRLGQLPGVSLLAIAVLVVGSVCAVGNLGLARVRKELAIPIGLFSGAVMFLVLTGAVRAGVNSFVGLKTGGPRDATEGRYAYVVITLVAPLFAVAVDAMLRRWRRLLPAFLVVLVACTPAYLLQFRADAFTAVNESSDKQSVLAVPRLPFANQLPRDLQVATQPRAGFLGGFVRLGWLLDAAASGRVPSPDDVTPQTEATLTLQLAVAPSKPAEAAHCVRIQEPSVDVLEKGHVISVRDGDVFAVYESPRTMSLHRKLRPGSYITLAGPLTLQFTPAAPTKTVPTVCT